MGLFSARIRCKMRCCSAEKELRNAHSYRGVPERKSLLQTSDLIVILQRGGCPLVRRHAGGVPPAKEPIHPACRLCARRRRSRNWERQPVGLATRWRSTGQGAAENVSEETLIEARGRLRNSATDRARNGSTRREPSPRRGGRRRPLPVACWRTRQRNMGSTSDLPMPCPSSSAG